MLKIFDLIAEDLKNDVVMLCLCVTAMGAKISLKEKRDVKRLCRA